MTALNLLKCFSCRWWKLLIYNNYTNASTSSFGTLYSLYNYGCSSCICIWILVLPCCQLLCRLAFWICRLARRGPRVLITETTSDILHASHLKI